MKTVLPNEATIMHTYLPVAPSHASRASSITIRIGLPDMRRVRATEVPVIPLPMMTTSA